MKTKVKFDKALLIDFFANNGEKIVFGIVVLIFFMFIWNAYSCERYDKQPEDVEAAITRADRHIADADPRVDRKIVDYEKLIKASSDPIKVEPYNISTVWAAPVFPPLRKRSEPTLFPVENLVVTAGHGRFSDTNRGDGAGLIGNTDPVGKRWFIITGLVNREEYKKSFQECFEDVIFKTQADYPRFVTYRVERAEVTEENQDPATLQWEKPYQGTMNNYVATYTGVTGGMGSLQNEKANPANLDPALIFPLPSRVDRPWYEEVYHDPEIPMIDRSAAGQKGMFGMGAQPTPENDVIEGNDIDDPDLPTGFGADRPELGMGGVAKGTAAEIVQQKLSPYLLFRFFDFNAKPGKRYQYRVRLYLANPNYNVAEKFLEPELAARSQDRTQWRAFIVTAWSKPSEVAHMPLDDSLLIAEVKQSTRLDAEPTGTITAIHWDFQKGEEVFDEFPVARGMVVNLYDKDMPDGTTVVGRDRTSAERGAGRTSRSSRVAKEKVNYVTEMLVLDLKGGNRLPGRGRNQLYEPSSILLFSPSGAMMVRSSIVDDKEREKLKNLQPDGRPTGGGLLGP